jgi:hypothetical protein
MFVGSRMRRRKVDNLAIICELIVQTMWDPQHLKTLQASTACAGIVLIYIYIYWAVCSVVTRVEMLIKN